MINLIPQTMIPHGRKYHNKGNSHDLTNFINFLNLLLIPANRKPDFTLYVPNEVKVIQGA